MVFGWLGVFVCDISFGIDSESIQPSVWYWLVFGLGPFAPFILVRYLSSPSRQVSSQSTLPETAQPINFDWQTVENWLRSERPADDDLLGHRRVAARLAVFLSEGNGSIGLLGPFGSGKSSVIGWMKIEAERLHKYGLTSDGTTRSVADEKEEVERLRKDKLTELVFVEQSCWGFEDSASAVQQLLGKAVEAAGRRVDCFSLRSLPEAYRKTFSAGGDWLRTLVDNIPGTNDPQAQLCDLADKLESVNARLVFVIEDLDRTTSSRFDRQEFLAVLERLRRASDRLSFVLAIGETTPGVDFARLCDRLERLPEFTGETVMQFVATLRQQCGLAYPDDRPMAADMCQWNRSSSMILRSYGVISVEEAVSRLLRTPRSLKHALRRTNEAWSALHGEVHWDQLFAVNVLRYGASEAFNFLIRNWDQLCYDPTKFQSQPIREQTVARIFTAWQKSTREAEWDLRAGATLLLYLLPSAAAYLHETTTHQTSLQGVHERRYWDRAVMDHLDSAHVPDQTILRDIAAWRNRPCADSALVSGMCGSAEYCGRWQAFAYWQFGQDSIAILTLAEHILERYRTPEGARVNVGEDFGSHLPDYAFGSIRRYATDTLHSDHSMYEWLQQQIRLALPVSLPLVNDLYYWWANNTRMVRTEDRDTIRTLIHRLVREFYTTGSVLIRALHPVQHYALYQLVFPPDQNVPPSPFRGVDEWAWLGPVMLEALRTGSHAMACEVAHLISDRQDMGNGATIYQVNQLSLACFFGSHIPEVIRLLADARDRLTGNDCALLDQVVMSARAQIADGTQLTLTV